MCHVRCVYGFNIYGDMTLVQRARFRVFGFCVPMYYMHDIVESKNNCVLDSKDRLLFAKIFFNLSEDLLPTDSCCADKAIIKVQLGRNCVQQ